MVIKYLRNLTLIALLLVMSLPQAWARQPQTNMGLMGESTLSGRIVEVNEEYSFVVVNLGSADGVKKGMVFSVFQKDEEAAKIKVTKVRRHIAACSIQLVYTGRGIGVGDIVIYKWPSKLRKILKPLEPTAIIEVEPIVVDIDAPKRTILLKTIAVFKEFGTVITDSDPSGYTLKAYKNLEMPLNVDLLTDWGPYVRNKVYYNVEVATTPRYNRLIINLRGVYDSEGQVYNHEIKKVSPVYKETQEMAFSIKDLSEKF